MDKSKKRIKIALYIYLLLSIIIGIYTIGELLSKHTRLKYGSDKLSLLGEDPYVIIKSQVGSMIDYIYVVGVYILLGIILGIYILKKIKEKNQF